MKKYPIHEHLLSLLINICTLGTAYLFGHTVHKSMTRDKAQDYNKPLFYCCFNRFKQEFKSVEWAHKHKWGSSLFSTDERAMPYEQNYLHASIFIINGNGYILSTYGYIRACFLIKTHINKIKAPKTRIPSIC